MKISVPFVTTLILLPAANGLFAQGTAFNYQGRLNSSGSPANGSYDFRFKLDADALGNTNVTGYVLTNSVAVSNGLFAVTIDFGTGIFNGSNYWLDVEVRTNNPANTLDYTSLTPLQPVTPTPYALFANTASNVSGTVPASAIVGAVAASSLIGSPYPLIAIAGLGGSGQPMLMTAVPAGSVKEMSINFGLIIGSPTPFASSCGGIVLPMFSTNSHMHGYPGTFYTNATDGTPIYLIDANAAQITTVGQQYDFEGTINGGSFGIFADPTWQRLDGTFCNANSLSGGLCDYFMDDIQTNATVHWPGLNQPGATTADPRFAIGGIGAWDAGSYNIARRQLTGWFLTAGTTNMSTTNIFQANVPHSANGNLTLITNAASIGTNGTVYANFGLASKATNTYSVTSTGFTNSSAKSIRIFGFTGTSVTFSNSLSMTHFSIGTTGPPGQMLILQPGESLVGTSCAAAGTVDF